MTEPDTQARIDRLTRDVRQRFEASPPQAMTDEDSHRLDMIVQAIGAVEFPASRDTLIREARRVGGADGEELVVELRSLPDDARYGSIDELLLAMGVGSASRIDVPGAPPRRPDAGPPLPDKGR